MNSYDAEFRGELLAACDANEGTRNIAVRFKVSESWVRRIKQQRRETGQVAPKKAAARQPKWRAWSDWLVTKIAARPDIYLRELKADFEAGAWRRGLPDDDLQRLPGARPVSKKKTLIASEQDRADVAEKRTLWRATQEQIDPGKVVFIDETWAKTNMTRTYGRSLLGSRLIEKTPCGRLADHDFPGRPQSGGIHRAADR